MAQSTHLGHIELVSLSNHTFPGQFLFVLRYYDLVNPMGQLMLSTVSLPNHTFTVQT